MHLKTYAMLNPIIETSKISELKKYLSGAEKIVITTHTAPDGDALGSSLAMSQLLSHFGKRVHVVTPDVPPETLSFIPSVKEVVPYTKYTDFATKLFAEAELILCLDFNSAHRVDRMENLLLETKAPKILIDHHTNPDDFPVLAISHPEISSTCMLLFRVICQCGWLNHINKTIATCIYIGMMTDTGNFSYNSQDPNIYIVIAELLHRGIDKDELYRKAFNVKKESQLRLNGYAIDQKMKIYPEHAAALISLTLEELDKYSYDKGDTEGLVNMPLAIPGVKYVAFIREGKEYTKISMRSVGNVPVNEFCSKHFGGGGHINAAGGEYSGSIDDAIKIYEAALPDFDKYIKNKN